MPIYRMGSKVVFFSHVPKCGGAAVEKYLSGRIGCQAFYDGSWRRHPDAKWCVTSPQHITAETRRYLFGQDFFDHSFCVVRNPETRLISAFAYNRALRVLPWHASFKGLLRRIERGGDEFHRMTDNHFRPMTSFVAPGDAIFRLEYDLGKLVSWIDDIVCKREGERVIPHHNVGMGKFLPSKNPVKNALKRWIQPPVPELTPALRANIFDLFKGDYAAFGYASPESDGEELGGVRFEAR